MCTRYISPEQGDVERHWQLGARQPMRWAPAAAFFEPCWETGQHVPWRFSTADASPWGLAGLWNRWTDPATGEQVESYTMLTINADGHPLMGRMHRPDPQRPPEQQDKRSVVPIALQDVDTWLFAPPARAAQLVRVAPADWFVAEPQDGR
ncbi:MAG: DUF159 family protein [Burkholderiales bacterium PBB5]|nr:MAG: DUF159 family protein [Burkholderiales bacterium PBB5]